ncbi:hypothetical protein M9Y10_039036 [Tritrichomonas musculus]|uniref:USP domain-containing protein n=1 Tax=Tritrichomonas musculus TaxID=1915356 RepID=A0ABR2KB44_9EUKA
MNYDPYSDFLSWAKISHQAIKTKSTCIDYLEQFTNLLKSYFKNSHKLPKPIEQYTKQFEKEVVSNVISNVILINDGNDIFVTNLTTFLKEINKLFFEDILKGNSQHIETFLLIFNSSNKLYAHGMTPYSKSSTFSDVSSNFLKENPFQKLAKKISETPNFLLFHVLYSLFENLKSSVNQNDIENTFHQTINFFISLLQSIKSDTLNTINPKIINSVLKYVFKHTSQETNCNLLWEKCADFLQFELKSGDSEHQTMAGKSILQMATFSDLYRNQVLERINNMNLIALLISNENYDEKLIGYFTSIISQFLTVCMPRKSEILQIYDIITDNKNSKLKPLFFFFIKNLPAEISVDLFSTIFDTRPTTIKQVEILSLCVSELLILNFMVGNKIINHFMVLIENDETAEISIVFFQKILPLMLPKEIIASIVEIANRKFEEPVIKDTSIYFMKTIITVPNRLTMKFTFQLFNSIVRAIELHENQAETCFDMIISALTIYQKSVLSTEQLRKLLPIINRNQWWEKLGTIFLKRSSLFFTLNGLNEFENEINKFNFEKASPQFTLFLLSFISHLCVYQRVYSLATGNYISVRNIPDLHLIIRIILKTPDHQSFVYVMNYYILIWNHLEKVSAREVTLHFLQCFMPYINPSSPKEKEVTGEVKNRIFQLMSKLIEVLEKSVSIEDFGLVRHRKSEISEVYITAVIQNMKPLKFSVKENHTHDDILKKTAFLLCLSLESIKFKEFVDPYQQVKLTNVRTFEFEIVKEKKMELKLQDIPTQIFVDNGIDEILLSYLEHDNSTFACDLLDKLPTNRKLMKKLSNTDNVDPNFILSHSDMKFYFRYTIESLLEVIQQNSDDCSSYQKYGILILKELINGKIEGEEVLPALEIVTMSNPDLSNDEIKETLIFLLTNDKIGFTPLFDKIANKYPKQICKFFIFEKSIKNECIYAAPLEYLRIICSLFESYDRDVVFHYLIELVTHLYMFHDSIDPILSLYDKIVSNEEEALLLIDKINSNICNVKQKQYPDLCLSMIKFLDRFPSLEKNVSQLIPYVIDNLYSADDTCKLLNFLVRLKKSSSAEICKKLEVHCNFYKYSTEENKRSYFTGLQNDTNRDLNYLSSILQQLFFLQSFKSLVISEKVDFDWYDSFRKLFCILQFSTLPFYPMSELYISMNLEDMSNPSRFYDLIISRLPIEFTSLFEGSMLDLQQDLTNQAISTTQIKFQKILLNAKEMYSIDDSLSHFFQEEKVPSKQAVHHYTMNEFPEVLVLLLKIFVYDNFEDLLSKVGTKMIVSDTLQLPNQSNQSNVPVYNLHGVIYHKGRIKGGKYISQIIHNGHSYLFDNSIVSDFERTEDMSPFLLFYVKQGSEEVDKEIEIPDDYKDFIHEINENYQRNQILFSENFRSFVLNFNDALLITRYLINIYCHSKFDPNLIENFLNKELINVVDALNYYQSNIDIINVLKDKQMKKMILYLAKVLIKNAHQNDENEAIDSFFMSCIENIESCSLYELMIYYLTLTDKQSEITAKWGEKVALIIVNSKPNFSILFQILSILKYREYQYFFADEVISNIYSDNISSSRFVKYLKSIDADVKSIIELTPSEFCSNLLISSIINDFMDVNIELLKSGTIEKKYYLQTFLNGLDNKIEGLRESVVNHFSFYLDFLPIPEGKFAEALVYYLFPNVVNPIDRDNLKKRMKFNLKKKSPTFQEEYDEDDSEKVEEEEEEEWEEEEINQEKVEDKKVEKVSDDDDKLLMNNLFQLIVKFMMNLNNDQPIYYILRVIEWMVDVADCLNNDLINACLQIMNKKIESEMIVRKSEIILILKIMKTFPHTFFASNFNKIIQFTLPTSKSSIFSHFFYTTSDFLREDSNKSILNEFIESSAFCDSFRVFLKKSGMNDLDIFIDNAKKISNLNLSQIMEKSFLHHLTIQKVICYLSFASEIDKKMTNHLIRFYFKKCSPFKDKYAPLFGHFTHSISQIMKPELSRTSMYLKNSEAVFSLFENEDNKVFRKEMERIIVTMSNFDSSVRIKFVELIMNCNSKKSRQLQLYLYSTFFYICEDSHLINHNLEMLANFIDNCKQKEVTLILNSINSMLSKRLKYSKSGDDSQHVANGIEIEKIYDILIILIDFFDWIEEVASCFEFVVSILPPKHVLSLVDALLDVVEEKDDEYDTENADKELNRNDQPFSKKISNEVLIDVIKKGVSFIKARSDLRDDIIVLFRESGYLDNWPPELDEYSKYYY